MLKLIKVSKIYELNDKTKIVSLNEVDIDFLENKFYGIVGHSGSGKSTLINILGLIDNFSSGEYYIDNIAVHELSEDEKAVMRMQKFGFVFQSFYLNPNLTALENVMIPMIINSNINKNDRKQKAEELLIKFGLKDRLYHKPNQMSGGEQQRVAIARALANDPEIIIADEPTGNLDKDNELMIFDYLKKLVIDDKKTVILVTHNDLIKKYADNIFIIESGQLVNDGGNYEKI